MHPSSVYALCDSSMESARVQAVDSARAGKLTGMLLELDVHEIIPLLVFPDMVR